VSSFVLYGYWRSSAAYRVRIALEWKRLSYSHACVDLRTGVQAQADFTRLNPQGLVPFLQDGALGLSQSLAIIEYLEESYPLPALLPADRAQRAHIRAMAQVVACDIHPLNNLRVQKYLVDPLGHSATQVETWAQRWIVSGFSALEAQAHPNGPYLTGSDVTLADVCLVPQVYNARRVNTDLAKFPRLVAVEERLSRLPEFAAARPEAQPDAPV
jgi:maleylacetoacetate isomerase